MVELKKDEIITDLLHVWMNNSNKKEDIHIEWNYGDNLANGYYLLGVLDVIKDEIIQHICKMSGENDDREN